MILGSEILTTLIPVGALAGLVAGLFGIGGGVITVVALVLVLPQLGVPEARIMHVALGTSLFAIVMTSVSSTLSHHRRGGVRWPVALRLAPAAALGALAGGAVAHYLPDQALRVGFGLFLLIVALRLGRSPAEPRERPLPGPLGLWSVGGVIGALSSWTGIGGGSLSGPFLMAHGVVPREAVGTSAAVGFPIAVAGAAGYVAGGWAVDGLPAQCVGYVFWPAALVLGLAAMTIAPIGAKIAHALPARYLKMAYALLLTASALRVMWGAF
ncbi:MAG: sulfite exporter TauE/SafE family protein [Gammaproteobacteria bacterium]